MTRPTKSSSCLEIATIWMGCERDQTDVELQLLGDCDDMDGLRDRCRASAAWRLRKYEWAARETRPAKSFSCFEIATIWMGCETDVELLLLGICDDMDGLRE